MKQSETNLIVESEPMEFMGGGDWATCRTELKFGFILDKMRGQRTIKIKNLFSRNNTYLMVCIYKSELKYGNWNREIIGQIIKRTRIEPHKP